MQTNSQLAEVLGQRIASRVINVGLLLRFLLFLTALGVNAFADPSVNDPLITTPEAIVTSEDTAVTTGNVLANATVLHGGDWHLVSFTQAANGLVVNNGDGTFTYTPAADFNGADGFTYMVGADNGRSATGAVDITVTPVNDPPATTSAHIITDEDNVGSGVMPYVVDVDINTNGDTHTFVIVSPPEHGMATVVPSDQVGITTLGWDPVDHPLFAGYTLYYGLVGADTMAINVGNQTSYRITDLTAGGLYTFVVTAYDTFGNESDFSQELTYWVPYAGQLVYIPHPNFHGTDSFTYAAIDAAGASVVDIARVTVNPVNDVPIVVNRVVSTQEDTPVTTDNVLANAVDTDGDGLQIISFTLAASGIVAENGDGTFTYSPHPNFHGTDRFTYVVSDGNGGSATGTVMVTVIFVNDHPVANALSLSTSEDKAFILPAQWPASDIDDDILTLTDFTQPAHGRIVVRSNGSLRYIPDADFNGSDSFTYTVSDGMGGTATGVVTLTVGAKNDLPRADDDLGSTVEGVPTVINVLANDVDVDGDSFHIIAFTLPANGTVIDNGDGTFTYTPQVDFYGIDSFTYTVADSSGLSTTATVTVTVTPVASGGFETGDFTAWTTLGETRIETAAYGSGPTEGTFQALLLTAGPVEEAGDTGGAVPVGELETFLGLQPGSLDSISTGTVVEGSAIKRTFMAQAGTILSFEWNFLTNEVTNLDEPMALSNPDANDLVFVTITPLSLVADTFWTFVLSPTDFTGETGFATFTVSLPTTGFYTLGIGVVDVGDATGLSGLLLDNITLTPPASP